MEVLTGWEAIGYAREHKVAPLVDGQPVEFWAGWSAAEREPSSVTVNVKVRNGVYHPQYGLSRVVTTSMMNTGHWIVRLDEQGRHQGFVHGPFKRLVAAREFLEGRGYVATKYTNNSRVWELVSDICARYERSRNRLAEIREAWLDSDEYGFKCCYTNLDGELNWSYLVTKDRTEAIEKMIREGAAVNG